MDQKSAQALALMFNAFPQSATTNYDLLYPTYEAALAGVTDAVICETAMRFIRGEVDGHHERFLPTVAQFVKEARRITSLLPYRGRKSISPPAPKISKPISDDERTRMELKMPLWRASLSRANGATLLIAALEQGLRSLIALAIEWCVAVPEKIYEQLSVSIRNDVRSRDQHRKHDGGNQRPAFEE